MNNTTLSLFTCSHTLSKHKIGIFAFWMFWPFEEKAEVCKHVCHSAAFTPVNPVDQKLDHGYGQSIHCCEMKGCDALTVSWVAVLRIMSLGQVDEQPAVALLCREVKQRLASEILQVLFFSMLLVGFGKQQSQSTNVALHNCMMCRRVTSRQVVWMQIARHCLWLVVGLYCCTINSTYYILVT